MSHRHYRPSMIREAPLLQQVPHPERPRERILRSGGDALSDAELLAVLLRFGHEGKPVLRMADEVLREVGGLEGLTGATSQTLIRPGLGPAKAAALLAAAEIGRRLTRNRLDGRVPLHRPDSIAQYLVMRYRRMSQEVMGALYLDTRNQLIADVELFRGTLSHASVEPRTIYKEALRHNASALVLFHTHPSGDPTPSTEDVVFTEQVRDAGRIMGIRLVDHFIVGDAGRWVSMVRRGILEDLDNMIEEAAAQSGGPIPGTIREVGRGQSRAAAAASEPPHSPSWSNWAPAARRSQSLG